MSARRRIVLVLIGALAFGVVAAWAKGQDTDGITVLAQLRADFGNLSAPWLLVAFAAGAQSSRERTGALLGLAATLVALFGFYLFTTLVIDLNAGGFVADLAKELRANRVYIEGGLLSGPLFGALGGWWRRTRKVRASVVAGALLIGEPLVLAAIGLVFGGGGLGKSIPLLVRIVPAWGLTGSRVSGPAIAIYAAEFALGLALVVVALRRRATPAPG